MTYQLNFRRLGLLIHKQWVEHSRLYLYSVLALIGLLGIVFAVWIKIASPYFGGDRIFGIFLFGLFTSGAVFASVSFKMLEHKASGLFWWSLPASQLEKLLCVIFYNLVVFTLTYCLCFLLVEKLAVAYITSIVAKAPERLYFNEQSLNWAQPGGIHEVLPFFMYAFFAVQAFYIMGSVYFKRYCFVLTTIFLSLIVVSLVYYFSGLRAMLPEPMIYLKNLTVFYRKVPGVIIYHKFSLSPLLTHVLRFICQFIWAPVFWWVALMRIKEREV